MYSNGLSPRNELKNETSKFIGISCLLTPKYDKSLVCKNIPFLFINIVLLLLYVHEAQHFCVHLLMKFTYFCGFAMRSHTIKSRTICFVDIWMACSRWENARNCFKKKMYREKCSNVWSAAKQSDNKNFHPVLRSTALHSKNTRNRWNTNKKWSKW